MRVQKLNGPRLALGGTRPSVPCGLMAFLAAKQSTQQLYGCSSEMARIRMQGMGPIFTIKCTFPIFAMETLPSSLLARIRQTTQQMLATGSRRSGLELATTGALLLPCGIIPG